VQSLTHGSWSGNIVNRKPPKGGGVSFDQIDCADFAKNEIFWKVGSENSLKIKIDCADFSELWKVGTKKKIWKVGSGVVIYYSQYDSVQTFEIFYLPKLVFRELQKKTKSALESSFTTVDMIACRLLRFSIFPSVLQSIAVCCSVLHCLAMSCRACRLLRISTLPSVVQSIAVCCSILQCVAVCCSILQCVAVCCSILQCVAVCCSVFYLAEVVLHELKRYWQQFHVDEFDLILMPDAYRYVRKYLISQLYSPARPKQSIMIPSR